MTLPVVGIFVGGQARRMGGVAKGNLVWEGRTILERTLDACSGLSPAGALRVYLVGNSSAYEALGALTLADDPPRIGPIGGLRALLCAALELQAPALALAGDMPFLTRAIVARLCCEQPGAAALAPREQERWQPLFARYAPAAVLPAVDAVIARGGSSLQSVFAELGVKARELELGDTERAALIDWDRPNDVNRRCPESSP